MWDNHDPALHEITTSLKSKTLQIKEHTKTATLTLVAAYILSVKRLGG